MKGIRNESGTVLLTAEGQTTPAVAVDSTGKLLVSGAGGSGSAAAVRNDAASTNLAPANGADSKIAVDQQGKAFIAGTYLEDTVHTGADRGMFLLGVRNDSTTTLTSASIIGSKLPNFKNPLIINNSPFSSFYNIKLTDDDICFNIKDEDIENLILQGFRDISNYMKQFDISEEVNVS